MTAIVILLGVISLEVVGLILYMWRNTDPTVDPEMAGVLEILGKLVDSQPVMAEAVGKGIAAGITGWVGGSSEPVIDATVDHSLAGSDNVAGVKEADIKLFEVEDPWMDQSG